MKASTWSALVRSVTHQGRLTRVHVGVLVAELLVAVLLILAIASGGRRR